MEVIQELRNSGEILRVYCLSIHFVFTPLCLPDSSPFGRCVQLLFAAVTPTGQDKSGAKHRGLQLLRELFHFFN